MQTSTKQHIEPTGHYSFKKVLKSALILQSILENPVVAGIAVLLRGRLHRHLAELHETRLRLELRRLEHLRIRSTLLLILYSFY